MKSIKEEFIELYGERSEYNNPDKWDELLATFTKGWFKGVLWNRQVSEKYKDLPHIAGLRGEKEEGEDL